MRVYYISNAYDGAYFVLTDSIEVYSKRMMSYTHNLLHSNKTNHYSFGSVEMSKDDYDKYTTEANNNEQAAMESKAKQQSITRPALRMVKKEYENE